MSTMRKLGRRAAIPGIIYLVCALVYSVTLGNRAFETSPDDHYSHLADSFLHGQLGVVNNRPDGMNDWACYDTQEHGPCPNNRFSFPGDRYQWYVSFPPFPAVIVLPAVAAMGTQFPDRLFWALFAGLGPALLFVLLRFLSESGKSDRSLRDNLLLTALFAFGSVYYFTSVQGTVWFAAHVACCAVLPLYVLWGLDARRPALAGLMLGLAFMARPTTALLAIFFGIEALRVSRPADASVDPDATGLKRVVQWLRGVRWPVALRHIALFSAPILVIGGIAMWMNYARFEDPFEFGHTYLQIRWRPRIERWGLFNYHYLAKNLSVFLAGLPWLSIFSPHVKISGHGLALWITTPHLLLTLWPKRMNATMVAAAVAVVPAMILNLMYQNSGWVQFGYRFALDYMVLLFVLLAMGGRRYGTGFILALVFAVVVNTFGAITFQRAPQFYDPDGTQNVVFQPD